MSFWHHCSCLDDYCCLRPTTLASLLLQASLQLSASVVFLLTPLFLSGLLLPQSLLLFVSLKSLLLLHSLQFLVLLCSWRPFNYRCSSCCWIPHCFWYPCCSWRPCCDWQPCCCFLAFGDVFNIADILNPQFIRISDTRFTKNIK